MTRPLALLGVLLIAACGSPAPTSTSTPAPPANQLALLSSRGYESSGGRYYIVEGEVENLTTSPLADVKVKATWYDKAGTLLTSDDAMLDFNPLMPGQKSPFKTISRGHPQMATYTVAFQTIRGAQVPMDDRRK